MVTSKTTTDTKTNSQDSISVKLKPSPINSDLPFESEPSVMPIDPLPPEAKNEPNDILTTAIDTKLGSVKLGKFQYDGSIGDNTDLKDPNLDVDLFKVELKPGDRLNIRADSVSPIIYYKEEKSASDQIMPPEYPQLDSALRLFDANGKELAIKDYFYIDENNYLDAFIDYKATTEGTYYFGISSYGNTDYKPTEAGSGTYAYSKGEYHLEVSVFPGRDLRGTADDDLLSGTDGDNKINGLGGDDKIQAGGGNDTITGDKGDDWIATEDGNDLADSGAGNDRLSGNAGDDTLKGDRGIDVILGGSGNDRIDGGKDNDRLFGEAGNDTILGKEGNDAIEGGQGLDSIEGGAGKDYAFGDAGDDKLTGDAGNDFLSGGDDWDSLAGGDGNDILSGDAGSDVLQGDKGNDRLVGYDLKQSSNYETDTLTGGAGKDTFVVGDKDEIRYVDADSQTSGDYDYALITDFNIKEDTIQLKGSAQIYSLDFFTTSGRVDAAIIYDPNTEARGEVVSIVRGVSENFSSNEPYFSFV
jgi:Ca2+-binding RTX toxin-like protein